MRSHIFSLRGLHKYPGLRDWWVVVAGLLVLYLPTYARLATSTWTKEEYSHGPIIFLVIAWLVWKQRDRFHTDISISALRPLLGGFILFIGLLMYSIGRSQDILVFEVGSQIPVFAGILLCLVGYQSVKLLLFPLFFIVFLVPLPGFILDAMTGPLKQNVSIIVEQVLYWGGYPIARSGVVLTIGHYQLLIADACSGLNSMYSLSALGLLYAYLRKSEGIVHNIILLVFILPIAFIANIGRVTALVLITYYFGYEAGEGFLHDFAGIAEFIIALASLILIDRILSRIFSFRRKV